MIVREGCEGKELFFIIVYLYAVDNVIEELDKMMILRKRRNNFLSNFIG